MPNRAAKLVVILLGSLSVLGSLPVLGQTPAKEPAFEVVSIRQNKSGVGKCTPLASAGTADGYHLTNCLLLLPILTAYTPSDMGEAGFYRNDRLVGVPAWLNSEHYDIDARVSEADLPQWQGSTARKVMLRAMLQEMLAERLKLAVHREWREMPDYALVIGKNGPKLIAAADHDSQAILRKHPGGSAIPGGLGGGVMVADPARGEVWLYNSSMVTVALLLSNLSGRPVVDKTGLTGTYDIDLHTSLSANPASDEAAESGPSVFTAVQEQLGLKLEPEKGKVENLVFDHVERPSEN